MAKAQGKKWYHSKTVWYNGLTLLLGVAVALGVVGEAELNDLVQQVAAVAVALGPAVNLILRVFFTTQPVNVK